MFKRWIILLLVVMAMSAAASYHYRQEFLETFSNTSVSEGCMDYLETLDDDWTRADDAYWQRQCSRENYYSEYEKELR